MCDVCALSILRGRRGSLLPNIVWTSCGERRGVVPGRSRRCLSRRSIPLKTQQKTERPSCERRIAPLALLASTRPPRARQASCQSSHSSRCFESLGDALGTTTNDKLALRQARLHLGRLEPRTAPHVARMRHASNPALPPARLTSLVSIRLWFIEPGAPQLAWLGVATSLLYGLACVYGLACCTRRPWMQAYAYGMCVGGWRAVQVVQVARCGAACCAHPWSQEASLVVKATGRRRGHRQLVNADCALCRQEWCQTCTCS